MFRIYVFKSVTRLPSLKKLVKKEEYLVGARLTNLSLFTRQVKRPSLFVAEIGNLKETLLRGHTAGEGKF